ncbi:L-cystine transporter [Paenibacillus arenosi]|uniref:L-cystine uptake protein TcyP n=1 Tax=Paenibacillus arenosi TaxID=2774142 RepID=A0ABR9B2N1_9BACL|nr:L-cystine transporter [Paenibacillus arenosi]MBD8499416.1 L-cystine transporter [Paenibacillus arenosi]
MTNLWIVLLCLAAAGLLIGLLYRMQRKHVPFTKRVFAALGIGVGFGALLQLIFGVDHSVVKSVNDWLSIAGTGYVKLLQMVVIPLIFVSIISAIIHVQSKTGLGKMSATIIGILVGTTAIAAVIAISVSLFFGLSSIDIQAGEQEVARGEYLDTKVEEVKDLTLPQQVLEFIPVNPFLDMTGARRTSTIAVVVFAAFIGVAALGVIRKKPEHGKMFMSIIDALHAVVMRMVTIVLRLTPYGVFALMTKVVSTTAPAEILKLGEFVVASYVALALMLLVHALMLAVSGISPIGYFKRSLSTLAFSFTSRSSAGAIPMNIETQVDRLGVPQSFANFSATFGASIGQNGCAGIYPAMLAIMIAPSAGINPLDLGFLAQLVAVVAISSFGVAGVGGGATFAALIVLSSMNLPVALAGLLISVEPLIDMGRTLVNVNGSMTAGVLSSRWLGHWDREKFNKGL